MASDIDKFVHDQLSVWPAVAAKYRVLKSTRTRTLPLRGMLVTLQSNPGRMPIFDHGCPLCEENYMEHQHTLPFEGRKGRKYNILVNRAPIFPNHLVITRDIHAPQTIWHRFPDMLDLAAQLENYIVFYNSPNSGTTVPQHAHFQACPKGYMPLERVAERLLRAIRGGDTPAELRFITSVRDAQLYHFQGFNRGIFMLRATTSKSMAKLFYRLLDCLNLLAEETEPRFNAFTYCSEGEFRAVVILRSASRPQCYYAEGDAHFARLLWRLVRTQPRIEVGIVAAPQIGFEIISDGAGPQQVSYREGKIDYNGVLYDELVFEAVTISTLFAEPSFILYGEGEPMRFAGTLKFIVSGGKVQAVNVIGAEDYLLSVVSLLPEDRRREAAIAIRTRLMELVTLRRTGHNAAGGPELLSTEEVVTWLAHRPAQTQAEAAPIHARYDVSAEEQGQRYIGLTPHADAHARTVIDETWGQTNGNDRHI